MLEPGCETTNAEHEGGEEQKSLLRKDVIRGELRLPPRYVGVAERDHISPPHSEAYLISPTNQCLYTQQVLVRCYSSRLIMKLSGRA